MEIPNVPIGFVPAHEGDILKLAGGIVCRIQEDGSRTGRAAEFTLPPNTKGPPTHWHEMHDETFLVQEGSVRFHAEDGKHIDAKAGDYVVVPPRAPRTFSNPTDQQAEFFNTFTPAFYIQYFKLLSEWAQKGEKMSPGKVQKAMAYFATIGVEGPL
ncbi:hypothetical protein LTR85_009420 [Meristemomyces frigidus]|nr:hypothetical protein LTR85_009420 [Meristemomyces frigidus]